MLVSTQRTFPTSRRRRRRKFQHNVEVETIKLDDDIGAEDLAQYLHIKNDKRNLGWHLHEKAYAQSANSSEDNKLRRKVWLFLLAVQEGAGRNRMLRYIGLLNSPKEEGEVFSEHGQTTVTNTSSNSNSNPTSTTDRTGRSTSVVSAADTDASGPDVSVIKRLSDVNWAAVDGSEWELILDTIRQDHSAVIRALVFAKQHMAAMMYSAQHDTDIMDYGRLQHQNQ
uniref:Nuclear pore complex protein n=1 Tax=Caenorhabditis tropicalis TaxID=1561998 RepID=A0A1I7UCY9_9PELO